MNDNSPRWLLVPVVAGALGLILTGCSSPADVASQNNAQAADNFELNRRIFFYNVRLGEYEKVVEGRCSIDPQPEQNQLEVICKVGVDPETGEGLFLKHTQGQAGDFTYFMEQLDPNTTSEYHYRVIFRPQTIVPAPELDWAN